MRGAFFVSGTCKRGGPYPDTPRGYAADHLSSGSTHWTPGVIIVTERQPLFLNQVRGHTGPLKEGPRGDGDRR